MNKREERSIEVMQALNEMNDWFFKIAGCYNDEEMEYDALMAEMDAMKCRLNSIYGRMVR